MAKITCETCNGTGEAVFSCCTGDVVVDDIMMCPVCHEHLGEETCTDCEGTGEVEEGTVLADKTYGVQSQSEFLSDELQGR